MKRAKPVTTLQRVAATIAVTIVVLVPMPDAIAQNVARGQTLYGQLGCNAANCHGTNPAENLRNVLHGANSAGTIEYAALVRSEMNSLLTSFQNDQTVTIDIAAYLATIVPAPPPPPPRRPRRWSSNTSTRASATTSSPT